MAQIDWELIRKRMLIYKYQPGYFTGGVTPEDCSNWILYTGLWNDSGVWSDTCLWDDGPAPTTTTTTLPPYDSDAQAFFTAASITDSTEKTAVNNLVVGLKSNNLWSKMLAIYPFVGGSENSHKYNLKDPRDSNAAYRLNFVGTFSHTSNGVVNTGGVGSYADTYFNTSTLSATKISLFMYINAAAADSNINCYDSGSYNPGNLGLLAGCGPTNTTFYFGSGGNWVTTNTANTIGFYAATNDGSTSTLYKNGTSLVSQSVSFATTNQPLVLFANNNNGNKGVDPSSRRQAMYAMSIDSFDSTEMSNFYTLVQSYQTSLGRQV